MGRFSAFQQKLQNASANVGPTVRTQENVGTCTSRGVKLVAAVDVDVNWSSSQTLKQALCAPELVLSNVRLVSLNERNSSVWVSWVCWRF